MILEAQPPATSSDDGRTGQHRKSEIMRKPMKSYRQVFESLVTSFPEMEHKARG
ncbi:MAG TPA: hypothetical protein VGJ57_12835 [Nitrospirales bacterium]